MDILKKKLKTKNIGSTNLERIYRNGKIWNIKRNRQTH